MKNKLSVSRSTQNNSTTFLPWTWFGKISVDQSIKTVSPLDLENAETVLHDDLTVYPVNQVKAVLSELGDTGSLKLLYYQGGKPHTLLANNEAALLSQFVTVGEVDCWVVEMPRGEVCYHYRNHQDAIVTHHSETALDNTIARDIPRGFNGWVMKDISQITPQSTYIAKEYNWYWGIKSTQRYAENQSLDFINAIGQSDQLWARTRVLVSAGLGIIVAGSTVATYRHYTGVTPQSTGLTQGQSSTLSLLSNAGKSNPIPYSSSERAHTKTQMCTTLGAYNTSRTVFAAAISGTTAYLGDLLSLQILDVSNPVRPSFLASLETPDKVGDIAISGTTAFIADWSEGLQSINVSNPIRPSFLGVYKIPEIVKKIAVSGNTAYVVARFSGLQIIDVSNPAHPSFLGAYKTSSAARDVAISGYTAYVAAGRSGLEIIDVSNPAHPSFLGSYETDRAIGVAISGTTAFLADWFSGLEIIDVSNPAHPSFLGAYKTPGEAISVTISGATAYVVNNSLNSSLQIIDVSNPRNPTLLCSSQAGGSQVVAIQNGLAYLVGDRGLEIIQGVDNITSVKYAPIKSPGMLKEETPLFTNQQAFFSKTKTSEVLDDEKASTHPIRIST